jgi:hypothetical protein
MIKDILACIGFVVVFFFTVSLAWYYINPDGIPRRINEGKTEE